MASSSVATVHLLSAVLFWLISLAGAEDSAGRLPHISRPNYRYGPNSQVSLGAPNSLVAGDTNSSATYWLGDIDHTQSKSIYDSSYVVYRNVKDFGAKGDGFSDDTKAIQNAISCMSGTH
jgi:polygalacturonase